MFVQMAFIIMAIRGANSCDDWIKIGCYKKSYTAFTEYAANNRDPSNSETFIGLLLKWSDFPNSLARLICECTKRCYGKYTHFAVGFYGECFCGNITQDVEENHENVASDCVNGKFLKCTNLTPELCTGVRKSQYVYKINGDDKPASFEPCSASCGGGHQLRKKTFCKEYNCSSQYKERRSCNTIPCPVDGGFSQWSAFSQCSVTCGIGYEERHRNCTFPIARFGGEGCSGPTAENRTCSYNKC